jgi:ADP-ribose pyrophosphatase
MNPRPFYFKDLKMEHFINEREIAYTGKAFSVEMVHVTLPDGRKGIYDLVAHVGSVTILPLDQEGFIHFVRQYRIGAEKVLLELPAGTLNAGEDPLECAKREIREETGMGSDEFISLGDMYLAPGYASEHMYLYLAKGLFPSQAPGDDDEFIQVEKIPVRKAYEMAAANKINDSKSLATLLLAQPHLAGFLD